MKRWLKGTLIGLAAIIPTIYAIDLATTVFADSENRIKSQEQLNQVVEERAARLGMDADTLNIVFVSPEENKGNLACTFNHIEDGIFATEKHIDHELYHTYREHTNLEGKTWGVSNSSEWGYWFIREPQAILYSLTGLKL